jgi:hypothetical protein
MDTFWCLKGYETSLVIGLQDFVRTNMPHFVNISRSDFFLDLKDLLVIGHLDTSSFVSVNFFKNSELYQILNLYVEDLWKVTQLFNDPDKLEDIFPQF